MDVAHSCHQATLNPKWGGLVARYAWSFPTVGSAARGLLAEDLHQAVRQGLLLKFLPTSAQQLLLELFSRRCSRRAKKMSGAQTYRSP